MKTLSSVRRRLLHCCLLLGLALAAQPARAQEQDRLAELEREAAGIAARVSIELTLQNECDQLHLFSRFDLQADRQCRGEVSRLFRLLEIDGRIAFKSRLDELTRDEKVWKWLVLLKKAIVKQYAARKELSLWDATVRYTRGDTAQALEYIAVVFQNPKAPEDVVARLNAANAPQETVDAYEKVNLFLIPDAPILADFPGFSPYPKSFSRSLPNSLYHFYVTAYLSQRMRADGAGEGDAFYFPFAMDEAYGILMQRKADAERAWGNSRRLLHGEKPLARGDLFWRASKVYVGYLGALFGLGRMGQAVPLDAFTANFTASSSRMMKGFYRKPF